MCCVHEISRIDFDYRDRLSADFVAKDRHAGDWLDLIMDQLLELSKYSRQSMRIFA